jgi:hypothetical protein
VERRDDYTEGLEDLLKGQKLNGELRWEPEDFQPPPVSVAVTDPENHEGLEFPGRCAMYGRLGIIAERHERLQLGWLYPSLLIVASSLDIEDADRHVRANEYGALLGPVHCGKNIHMDAALASIQIPNKEEVILEDAPGSHSGLMNQLSEDEPVHRLLFLDELINVFNACAIQGSNLPSMLCTLWDKDKTGGSVKKGRQFVYGELSIVGGLAINDISDFSRVFGSHSVKGIYDRFIFGYSTSHVRYRPSHTVAEHFDLKPVHFPDWVWEVKDQAELLTLEMDQTERWKLIHFTDVMNSKSYYRTYSSMIGRVRKTLVEEGFIGEVREVEEDGKGGVKKSKAKTPFVILLKEVK